MIARSLKRASTCSSESWIAPTHRSRSSCLGSCAGIAIFAVAARQFDRAVLGTVLLDAANESGQRRYQAGARDPESLQYSRTRLSCVLERRVRILNVDEEKHSEHWPIHSL